MTLARPEPGRLLPVAGILTPVCAVVVARVLFSTGPAQAPAAEASETIVTDAVASGHAAPVALSAAQRSAIDYIATLPANGRSPMARPDAPDMEPSSAEPERPAPPSYDPTRDLDLSSVVGTGERGIASINGRIYRVGDQVIAGWKLTEVDVRNRTATLTTDDGRTCVLEYRQNG